jgi:hypothetical protein
MPDRSSAPSLDIGRKLLYTRVCEEMLALRQRCYMIEAAAVNTESGVRVQCTPYRVWAGMNGLMAYKTVLWQGES